MNTLGYVGRVQIIVVRIDESAIAFFDAGEEVLDGRRRHLQPVTQTKYLRVDATRRDLS